MPLDNQSLYNASKKYLGTGAVSGVQALKLALLEQAATAVNPMAATDVNSLLSASNVAGYSSASNASIADLLELSLLQIIASGVSGGTAGGGVTAADYGGNEPSFTPTTDGAVAIDTSTGRVWWWFNTAWN